MQRYLVNSSAAPIPPELRRSLQGVDTATIGHFEFFGFVDNAIRPVFSARACGTAVTVVAVGRDGSVIYRAIDLLREGDFLVVARVDRDDVSCIGGGVAAALKVKGAAGVIVDGPCTDVNELREIGVPVWCTGVSAKATSRAIAIGGAINVPIACGGCAVLPGYAVLADEEGAFVADAARMEAAAAAALARQERSTRVRTHLAAGRSIFDFPE